LERVFFCPRCGVTRAVASSYPASPARRLVYNRAMTGDRNVLAEWRESAPYWEKHAAAVRQLFAPISAALMGAARITAGQHVLDVAGGTGEPSLEMARVVGPQGRVVCTDAAAEMVAAAERLAGRQAKGSTRRCRGSARCFSRT